MAAKTASTRKDGTVASRVARCTPWAIRSGKSSQHVTWTGKRPGTGQLCRNKSLLVRQHHSVKHSRVLRVLYKVPPHRHDPIPSQEWTQDNPGAPALFLQIVPWLSAANKPAVLPPGLWRFQAKDLSFRLVVATPKPHRRKTRTMAGRLGQTLLAIRKESRITWDFPCIRPPAQFFHPVHQTTLILILRWDKAPDSRHGIRRRRHCSPARQSGHP